MARASDVGVDAMDALINELVATCCKLGCRRIETESIKRIALAAIERERNDPTGRDVVDMVMELAPKQYQHLQPVQSQEPRLSKKQRNKLKQARAHFCTQLTTTPEQLRLAKRTLEDLYQHEAKAILTYNKAKEARSDCVIEAKNMESVLRLRRVTEQHFMVLLENYMTGHGLWTPMRGRQIMRKYNQGEWEAEMGYNWKLLEMCPSNI